jgi:RNA polymerase sigma factor FliA
MRILAAERDPMPGACLQLEFETEHSRADFVLTSEQTNCLAEEPTDNIGRADLNSPGQDRLEASADVDAPSEQLLLEHLPLVQHIARRIHGRLPRQVLLEDLVHAGILGLIDAVRKFEPSKKVQLKHYAGIRIRGAILDSLRLVDWSPRALRQQGRRVDQATLRCKLKFGREPAEPEIASEMQVSLEKFQHLRGQLRGLDVSSLQSYDGEVGSEGPESSVESNEGDPYQQTLRSEMKTLLEIAVAELSNRERKVLKLYHFEELTMKEVAAIMRIGESRVSQINSAALLRLRVRVPELLECPLRSRPGLERSFTAARSVA